MLVLGLTCSIVNDRRKRQSSSMSSELQVNSRASLRTELLFDSFFICVALIRRSGLAISAPCSTKIVFRYTKPKSYVRS